LQLTIRIIECSPGLIEGNKNHVATHGLHRADVSMNGTMHLYKNKDPSDEVRFISMTDKDAQ
jgi:hypothetical protein